MPTAVAAILTGALLLAAAGDDPVLQRLEALERAQENAGHEQDVLEKKLDDLLWFQRVGDVAEVDKV